MAVNLGNNADTTGAYYGYPGIPEEWREKIAKRKLIESFGENLYRLSFGLFPLISDPGSVL
jgi:ADP-ribosylglycohydrolase